MSRSEVPKARRQARIAELLAQHVVSSQGELQRLLAADGWDITQSTVSRDLVELRAVRVRGAGGALAYAIPDDQAFEHPEAEARLGRVCQELVLRAEGSGNLVVVRTPAGAAQYVASALDRVAWPEVLGCVAGDDTVLVVTRAPGGGEVLAERLLGLGTEGES